MAQMAASEPTLYEFPPRERGGMTLGLSVGQLAIVVCALLGVIMAVQTGVPFWLVLPAAAPMVVFAVVPVGGERLTTLTVRWLGWFLRPRRTRRGPLTAQTQAGGGAAPATVSPPPWARGLDLVEVPYGGDATAGVWHDGDAFVAVLAVTAPSVALRDLDSQAVLLSGWGDLLASAGVDGSPVQRVGWIARTSPDQGAEAAAWWRDNADQDLARSPIWSSYVEAGVRAGTTAAARELLVVVRVQPDRARHRIRAAGRDRGARTAAGAALAIEEAERIGHRLVELDCQVEGFLTPGALAATVRTTFDPSARDDLAVWRAGSGDLLAGVSPDAGMWPISLSEPADHVRTDGGYHRAYWIEEWPTIPVLATWMHPLLLRSTLQRTVAMVMEPISTQAASRSAYRARAAKTSDAETLEKGGWLTSARSQRALAAAEQRELELVDGHCDLRFAGYVVVSAGSLEELDAASSTTIYEAGQARLRLRPLHGEHWPALAAVLPLGRFLW